MQALSSNHLSTDDQAAAVLAWLTHPENAAAAEFDWAVFVRFFPEWSRVKFSGAWVDTEAMGVDPEWMSWVIDHIEQNSRVQWDDGEPWFFDAADDQETHERILLGE